MNNQIQIMQLLKGIKNPKETVFKLLKGNNNPMVKSLIEMAEKGQNDKIEEFARNLFREQNRDFDQEFGEFVKNLK